MRLFLFLTILLFFIHTMCAQSIKGIILDVNKQGISSATIKLLNEDSTFVKGATTDNDGNYIIKNNNTGKYILSYSCVGYISEFVHINVGNEDLEVPVTTLTIDNVQLGEVEIKGQSYIRLKDRVLIIPGRKQVIHASTGYDLLYNLMIPGMDVDRRGGKISNFKGEVTLYIDGRKADYREVQSLRPRDVEKVEYIELPSGQYAGDNTSVNYITKKYKTGGYISFDAEQTIGYLKGDYNGVAKLTKGKTNYTFFGGHNMYEHSGVRNSTDEQFYFNGYDVFRHSETVDGKSKGNNQYGQLHIQNQNQKRTLLAKLSFTRSASPDNYLDKQLDYSGHYNFTQQSHSLKNSESIKPGIHLYGNFNLGQNRWLEVSMNGNYARNGYNRNYTENDFLSHTDVNEEFYNIAGHLKYTMPLKHNNSLTARLHHLHNISSSAYTGDYNNWQHLWSGESLLFVQYDQRLWKRVSLSVRPGMSVLQYRLHGEPQISYVLPRISASLSYQPAKGQMLYFATAFGNNSPDISTTNTAEQNIDFLQVKRGNAELKYMKVWLFNLVYALQVGKINMQLVTQYYRMSDMVTNNYHIENDKLIHSFQNSSANHSVMAELSLTWKMTRNLHLKNKTYAVRWIYRQPSLTQNALVSGTDLIYYWKDFSFNLSATAPYKVLDNALYRTKYTATYGASASWSYNGWRAEAGVNQPFTRHSNIISSYDTDVYNFRTIQYSRTSQQTGYIKVAYTFDFGHKMERTKKDVDIKINSAILKAE